MLIRQFHDLKAAQPVARRIGINERIRGWKLVTVGLKLLLFSLGHYAIRAILERRPMFVECIIGKTEPIHKVADRIRAPHAGELVLTGFASGGSVEQNDDNQERAYCGH